MEPTLRSAQVLKQEAEDLGFEGIEKKEQSGEKSGWQSYKEKIKRERMRSG